MKMWQRPDFVKKVIRDAWQNFGEVSAMSLRETLFKSLKECTQFKPSLVVAVIRLFQARRMLDFSAGWGDRLAGAIAANVDRYIAFDPNTSLRAGHDAIIERFVPPERRRDFTITYTGFEDAELADGCVDLVFTSPPFFTLEIYTDLPGQSSASYPAFNDWLVRFLFRCLHKAWRALVIGQDQERRGRRRRRRREEKVERK